MIELHCWNALSALAPQPILKIDNTANMYNSIIRIYENIKNNALSTFLHNIIFDEKILLRIVWMSKGNNSISIREIDKIFIPKSMKWDKKKARINY